MKASLILVLALAGLVSAQLDTRTPLPRLPVRAIPLDQRLPGGAPFDQLLVKFADEAQVRATPGGGLVSLVGADLSVVRGLADEHEFRFSPAIALPEAELLALQARAAARSGRAQPDLAGLLEVEVAGLDPLGMNAAGLERLEQLGAELQGLPIVEFASIHTLGAPPPGDIAPTTPNLAGNQTYRGPNPGLNSDFVLATYGLDGAGVRLSDCEYGWNKDHEDLVDINLHLEPGQTIHPSVIANGWDEHGTAVLGETSAVANAYGCTGMAGGAEVYTYTEWSVEEGLRRLTAITNAIADSDAGDVVLLEMQTFAGGPAEVDAPIWMVVKAGTDAGVVVVGAAGNGNQNLDSAGYSAYQALGNSGAIIVGAGSASTAHSKLSFSSFGSRVNVQGWGEAVFSLGYGDFAQYGGDKEQRYTAGFSGTSSASPFVASTCLLVQQWSLETFLKVQEPIDLRALLISTGLPQTGGGGSIGPFVQVPAAVAALPPVWTSLGAALVGTNGLPDSRSAGTLQAGDPTLHTLEDARGSAQAWLIIGVGALNAPFKGGTMVPMVDTILGPYTTTPSGAASLSGTTPSGLPSAVDIHVQWWIQDPVGVKGYAASDAEHGLTP